MKFVDKQLAIKLKEKGFDKPCFGWYYIKTPTGRIDGELVLNRYPCRGGTYEDTLESHINFPPEEKVFEYIKWNIVDAPTIEQVLEWLREEKKIIVTIGIYTNVVKSKYVIKIIKIVDEDSLTEHFVKGRVEKFFDNYDDAILAGIKFVVNDLI